MSERKNHLLINANVFLQYFQKFWNLFHHLWGFLCVSVRAFFSVWSSNKTDTKMVGNENRPRAFLSKFFIDKLLEIFLQLNYCYRFCKNHRQKDSNNSWNTNLKWSRQLIKINKKTVDHFFLNWGTKWRAAFMYKLQQTKSQIIVVPQHQKW